MVAPARPQQYDSDVRPPVDGSEAGARPFKPAELRVRELIEGQNRESTPTTRTEHRNGLSDAATIQHPQGSSDAVTIDLGRYMPRPLFVLRARESFQAIQKWEGYVLEVLSDTFRARLAPIRSEGRDQEAEIYLKEVDPDDLALIEPGAVFYWSIGYLDRPSGRMQASIIRFRRLPGWAKSELTRAEAEAERLRALFADE